MDILKLSLEIPADQRDAFIRGLEGLLVNNNITANGVYQMNYDPESHRFSDSLLILNNQPGKVKKEA
jgi:hypothetical protein